MSEGPAGSGCGFGFSEECQDDAFKKFKEIIMSQVK